MDSDTPLVVNLEVSVPRIVLPTGEHHSGQMDAVTTESTGDEATQVRILPIELQHEAALTAEQGQVAGSTSEVSERMSHAVRFHMFRGIVPAQSQPLLFHVLRWYKGYISGRRRKRKAAEVDNGYLYVSDASVFSVE